jgi:hypothetical protein
MNRRSLVLSAFALLVAAPPAFGQADAWRGKWYWGAQVGIFAYNDPLSGSRHFAPTAGGHWLITGKRSALYFGIDEIIFTDSTPSAIIDASAVATGGVRIVDFNSGRRIQATIFAIPMDKKLQVMLGGGFAIHQINGAVAQGPFNSLQEVVNAGNSVAELDTKAFLVMAVGTQYRMGRLALFANYNFMPGANDFLIPGGQHTLSGGIRYALTSAHEEVTTER